MNGRIQNLMSQIENLFRKNNRKSIKTRYRYLEATNRFCSWLGENTNLKKFKNIKCKHIYMYANYLKVKGYSSSYIKTDLSAIRFFYSLTDGKEILPDNKKFNLEKRKFGGVHRSWNRNEIEKAINLALEMGRTDVVVVLGLGYVLGTRLEEAVTLTTYTVKEALKIGYVYLENTKGWFAREVHVSVEARQVLEYALKNAKSKERILIGVGDATHKVKRSIQDWVRNNRYRFQNVDRVDNPTATGLAKKGIVSSANLTVHGTRHANAQGNYNKLIIKLGELNEVEYKNIFIDGTKIQANANKYTFVWKKSTNKFETKLQEKIQMFIADFNKTYSTEFEIPEGKIEVTYLNKILAFLKEKKQSQNIIFVTGKGKRKTKVQKHIELLDEFIKKQLKYDNYNNTFDGRNSFSKTDKDAKFMHMKEDHMRNSQLKPGYNIQIEVEAEYIVGIDVSSERSDQLTLIPFLDKLNKSLPRKFSNVVADAGYESEENYLYLENNNQNSFIKPQAYEGMKKRSFKKNIGKRENMEYDKVNDEYTCYNNIKLRPIGTTVRQSRSGYKSKVTIYEADNCDGCKYKSKCTKAKRNRRIQVSKTFIDKRLKSLENIISSEGIVLRMNRSIQVEGAFGVLKQDYGFKRFFTRGKKNIKIEFTLLFFGYNINKLHNKIQNNRCGNSLYNIKVA